MIDQLTELWDISIDHNHWVFRHKNIPDMVVTLPYMSMMLKGKSLKESLEYCYNKNPLKAMPISTSEPYALIAGKHMLYGEWQKSPVGYKEIFKAMAKGNLLRKGESQESPFFKMKSDIFYHIDSQVPQAAIGGVNWVWDYTHEEPSLLNLPYFTEALIQAQQKDLLDKGLEIKGKHYQVLSAAPLLKKGERGFSVKIKNACSDKVEDERLETFLAKWSDVFDVYGVDGHQPKVHIRFKLKIVLDR